MRSIIISRRRAIFFILSLLFIALTLYWCIFLLTPLTLKKEGFHLELKSGTSITGLAYTLNAQSILAHPDLFILLARLKLATRRLQAGEYAIAPGTRPGQLLEQLVAGRVILYPFTIVEGWQFSQLSQALHKESRLVHNTRKLSKSALIKHLADNTRPLLQLQPASSHSIKSGAMLEGRFFPSTYLFPRGETELAILDRAYNLMQKIVHTAWQNRAKGLPYKSPYQALIAASIIEKETSLAKERKRIAGVIVRRLQRGMKLQVDPTVIYGLGRHFNGNLTKKDMRVKSPYNTYRYRGLPPTPIALPGYDSLLAALHPAPGKALYFVAKGDGSHLFSDTLAAHRRAIRHYQLKQGRRLRKKRGGENGR